MKGDENKLPIVKTAWIAKLLLLLLLPPAVLRAQFTFTTNGGAITITGYTGSNSVVIIPSTTNGLPVISIGHLAFFPSANSLSSKRQLASRWTMESHGKTVALPGCL